MSNGKGLEPEFGILKADNIHRSVRRIDAHLLSGLVGPESHAHLIWPGGLNGLLMYQLCPGWRSHLITHREFEPSDIPGFISEVIETDEKVSFVGGWWVLKSLAAQKSDGHSGPCQDGGAGAKTSARFWLVGP